MNMNKALQNLYHAVSGETTTKRNITKLLLDIHYAITGKESENKNNHSRIVDSMATNWPEGGSGGGGGGSSDFSTAEVTIICNAQDEVVIGMAMAQEAFPPFLPASTTAGIYYVYDGDEVVLTAILYKGRCSCTFNGANSASGTGNIAHIDSASAAITGDCTITIS